MPNYYEEITDEVLGSHRGLKSDADQWGADTMARMEQLKADVSAASTALQSETFDPTILSSLLYQAPDAAAEPDYSASGPSGGPDLVDLGEDGVPAFVYTDARYIGQVKNQTKKQLLKAIAGEVPFLPKSVFDVLYDRAASDLGVALVAATWNASNQGAAMGWVLPSETTLGNLNAANDGYAKETSRLRTEHFIKEWALKHEDMWKGIGQGGEFEKLWLNEHNSYHARLLDAAGQTVKYAIDINNELIARNDQAIAAYAEEWKAVAIRIGAETQRFQSRIQNAGTLIDGQKTKLGFESKEIDTGLAVEAGKTQLAVQAAQLEVESVLQSLSKLAELAANVSMALMSASDVSLGTGTSFGTSESHSYAEKCCEDT